MRAAHVNSTSFTVWVFPEVVAPLTLRQHTSTANPIASKVMGVRRYAVVRKHTNAVAVVTVFAALRERCLYVNGAHMHGSEPLMAFMALVVLRKLLHHLSPKIRFNMAVHRTSR